MESTQIQLEPKPKLIDELQQSKIDLQNYLVVMILGIIGLEHIPSGILRTVNALTNYSLCLNHNILGMTIKQWYIVDSYVTLFMVLASCFLVLLKRKKGSNIQPSKKFGIRIMFIAIPMFLLINVFKLVYSIAFTFIFFLKLDLKKCDGQMKFFFYFQACLAPSGVLLVICRIIYFQMKMTKIIVHKQLTRIDEPREPLKISQEQKMLIEAKKIQNEQSNGKQKKKNKQQHKLPSMQN